MVPRDRRPQRPRRVCDYRFVLVSVAPAPVERDHVATAAPLGRRCAAALCDGALILGSAALLAWMAGVWTALGAVVVVAVVNELVAVVRTGQSFGWWLTRLQLVDANSGHPPVLGQVLLRNVLLGAYFGLAWQPLPNVPNLVLFVGPLPFLLFLPALFDHRWHRALYDRWTHTVLIDATAGRRP